MASRDPYWLTVRWGCNCRKCGSPIVKGARAFFYPIGRSMYCESDDCGGQAARDFAAAAFDDRA